MLRLTVSTPARFRFRSTLLSHGWIELAPFRHAEDFTELRRVERLADGRVVDLVFSAGPEEALHVEADGSIGDSEAALTETDGRQIQTIARRIFNVDVDLEPFYERIGEIERYGWVRRHGGGRLLRAPTVWEDLAKTLLTTNTTWRMTRQMVERLMEIGESGRNGYRAFPTPEDVASLSLDALSDQVRAGYRNAYLHDLATRIAEGGLDVEAWAETDLPTAELYERVRALKGFGPYAAGSVLKLLGRFDYLAIDSAARSTYAALFNDGERAPDQSIRSHYEPYGEWQGLVIWMDVMRSWFLQNYAEYVAKNAADS